VATPQNLSARQRSLLEELARLDLELFSEAGHE
jgi:hypothetical protein